MSEEHYHNLMTAIITIMLIVGFLGGSIAIYEHVFTRWVVVGVHDNSTTNDTK